MLEPAKRTMTLRQAFKTVNHFMVLVFRLGLGSWGNSAKTSQVMVLVHTGRKSGLRRTTPVNFVVIDGAIYCTAAFGVKADWYRNIMANPAVEVWLPDGWYRGIAQEIALADPQRLTCMRQVLIASGFAAPLFAGFNPKTVTDGELEKRSADYRLIRIDRTGERTGPGGPSDLAWIWPMLTFILLAILLADRFRMWQE